MFRGQRTLPLLSATSPDRGGCCNSKIIIRRFPARKRVVLRSDLQTCLFTANGSAPALRDGSLAMLDGRPNTDDSIDLGQPTSE